MQKSLLIGVLLCSLNSWAHTRVQFLFEGQAIVIISQVSPQGVKDDDAGRLFELMNVPAQDSFMGKGKAIVSENQDLNFVCGNQPGRGLICTIEFNRSSRLMVDPKRRKISYRMTDFEAEKIAKEWHLQGDRLEFVSTDGVLKMQVRRDEMDLEISVP